MTGTLRYRYPDALWDTTRLAAQLDDPALRVFDCTTWLLADSDDDPVRVASARPDYRKAHIPGSAYLELQADLSDRASRLRFTLPEPGALAAAFGRHGIGDDATVVLYSRGNPQWATRVWWMLRAIGFDRAAILDGGWEQWEREGRPVASGDEQYPPAVLHARPRTGVFVDAQAVTAALAGASTRVVNALGAKSHAGGSRRYGRPGRIAGSVNVPVASLRDPDTGVLVSAADAARAFAAVGVEPGTPVITYCGGGIAASFDAFVLHQLGNEQVAIYDNSLSEWAADPAFPMESD